MKRKQRTLSRSFTVSGRGLHTGAESEMTVHPGEPGSGYRIRSEDHEFPIHPSSLDGSQNRTIARDGEAEIHTVEHALAALYGLGVDNAVLEVRGQEVPGMDGSACLFADEIEKAGLVDQEAETDPLRITRPVAVSYEQSALTAYPTKREELRITYILHYPESRHAQGVAEFVITPENVRREICNCRTFVMKAHAEAMLKAGKGQGATTENTLVLDGEQVLENELRFPDECARHKILDVLGDLACLGRPLQMHVVAYKSGHALNVELLRALRREALHQAHPKGLLDIRQIEHVLPHRYPFLLVDRVVELEPRKRILAIKNVTRNEEFFQGHFPGQPIMPGVLQVEALAQTGGILMMGDPAAKGKLAVLMSITDVKYRRPVIPGDQLWMEVEFERFKGGRMGIVNARSTVDDEVVTEAKIKFALVDPEQYT